jgi:acyl-CoA dehydrogenase
MFIFPRGRIFSSPADELGQEIVELIINPTAARERLCDGIYKTREPGNPLGLLQEALETADKVRRLERKVFDANRDGKIKSDDTPGQIDEAERLGIISPEEAEQIRAFDRQTLALLAVDDFAPQDLARQAPSIHGKRSPRKPSKTQVSQPVADAGRSDAEVQD